MERELERLKEREPESAEYDRGLRWMMEKRRQREQGQVLMKAGEVPWTQSRMAHLKRYVGEHNWNEVAAPGWIVTRPQEVTNTGKHTHKGGGIIVYVLEGKGRTVNNDVNLDWEAGDMEILPVARFENVHQHFNLNPGKPWGAIFIRFWPYMEAVAHETVHMQDAPGFKGPEAKDIYRPADWLTRGNASLQGYDIKFDGPPTTLLDRMFQRRNEWRERLSHARLVIKKDTCPVETNRMGIYRWYIHPDFTDVACRHILFWVHEIPAGSRSGKQKHQGGRIHFVIEGSGYSIVEGKRYDWEAEDLLMLPTKAGGVAFQHFNSDPSHPARLAVAEINWYDALGVDMACGFEQIEDCPEWSAAQAKVAGRK